MEGRNYVHHPELLGGRASSMCMWKNKNKCFIAGSRPALSYHSLNSRLDPAVEAAGWNGQPNCMFRMVQPFRVSNMLRCSGRFACLNASPQGKKKSCRLKMKHIRAENFSAHAIQVCHGKNVVKMRGHSDMWSFTYCCLQLSQILDPSNPRYWLKKVSPDFPKKMLLFRARFEQKSWNLSLKHNDVIKHFTRCW